MSSANLDERLLEWVVLDRLDRDEHRLSQIDFLGNGNASLIHLPARRPSAGMDDINVRLDGAMSHFEPDPLSGLGVIGLRQP